MVEIKYLRVRHPREIGVANVESFLSMLANERKVSASTHNQALSALLFLYREVLGFDLPWLNNIGRPQQSKRIPAVLTKEEVAGLLAQLDGWTLTADMAWPIVPIDKPKQRN